MVSIANSKREEHGHKWKPRYTSGLRCEVQLDAEKLARGSARDRQPFERTWRSRVGFKITRAEERGFGAWIFVQLRQLRVLDTMPVFDHARYVCNRGGLGCDGAVSLNSSSADCIYGRGRWSSCVCRSALARVC